MAYRKFPRTADQSHREGTDFNFASIASISKSCFTQRTCTSLFSSYMEKIKFRGPSYLQSSSSEKMQVLFLNSDVENKKMYCFLRILD